MKRMRIKCLIMILSYSVLQAAWHPTEDHPPNPYFLFGPRLEALELVRCHLSENPVIIEAGAYEGKETSVFAQYWPQGHVHSFEPVERLYEIAARRVRSFPNVSIYPLGLGDLSGPQTIYLSTEAGNHWINRISMCSSFYRPKKHLHYSETFFRGTEVVQMICLDEWARRNGVTHVDLLWLDIQGYELSALKAGIELLKTVSVVVCAMAFVEAYEGQPLYREVKTWLEEQGFLLVAGDFHFPRTEEFFGYGLFVRPESNKNLIKGKL